MTRSSARRCTRGVALAVVAIIAAACSSGPEPVPQTLPPGTSATGSTAPTAHGAGSTVVEPRGSATITSFEIRNQISCDGPVEVTTAADYATEGATSVAFLVDGTQVAGTPPVEGSFDVPLGCDGRSHTVVLVAVDADGATTVDSRVVLTTTTPQGN